MTQQSDLLTSVAGSIVLWLSSAILAVGLALVLMSASLSSFRAARLAGRAGVNLARGVPTALWVVAAGIGALRLPGEVSLPVVFPGTPGSFQRVAWAVAVAVAIGSAGHLAEIFRSARAAIGGERLDQARLLGLSRLRRAGLIAREAAVIAVPPTTARLIHHLHNTAFAAFFPVVEVFGFVQAGANRTFRVVDYVLLGCAVYVTLSGAIWAVGRIVEARLGRTQKRAAIVQPA